MDRTNIDLTFCMVADQFDTNLTSQRLNIQPLKISTFYFNRFNKTSAP